LHSPTQAFIERRAINGNKLKRTIDFHDYRKVVDLITFKHPDILAPFFKVAMSEFSACEDRVIFPNTHTGKVIAVFTSGGDAQGMNSAVRAVVR
jgi:hypothetical protein